LIDIVHFSKEPDPCNNRNFEVNFSSSTALSVPFWLGWHFGDINVIVTLNLDHTTHIAIVSGPHNTFILTVMWSRFNVTVTLMSPKCHPFGCVY